MSIPFIDLNRQNESLIHQFQDVVKNCISTSNFILGSYCEEFEVAWADYVQTKHAIGCSNGTDALTIVLKALGIGYGDKVATPSHTFFATVESIIQVGATPIFIEIDPNTGLMDVSETLKIIGSVDLKAVVAVHLYGAPVDLRDISEICKMRNIPLIEDASQAHGATLMGRKVGSIGLASIFSCYPTKNLGALGDAGIITTSDSRLDQVIRELRDHGQAVKGVHKSFSGNMRLDGMQAGFLLKKLHHLDSWNQERRRISEFYRRFIHQNEKVRLLEEIEGSVNHLFVLLTPEREKMIQHLHSHGIGYAIHYPNPCHKQPAYSNQFEELSLPNTEVFCRRCVSLPCFPGLTESELDKVVMAVNSFD